MIPLFTREGTQNILAVEHARSMISLIKEEDLSSPLTTYRDAQCGTGLIMLVLAERLMDTLAEAIPNEQDRLSHIFGSQLILGDIDNTQCRIARANLLRAIGCRDFAVDITNQDCFANTEATTYTLGSIDFETTNQFVPFFRNLSEHVIIVTRANKHSYESKKITELSTYWFLGIAQSSVPICIMHFEKHKQRKDIRFTNGTKSVKVTNPTFLPGMDLDGYMYVEEVLKLKLDGYNANYGRIGRKEAKANPGRIPLMFGAGNKEFFGEIIKVSKNIISSQNGLGKIKLITSKNGNRGQKNLIKFAGPEYALGETTLWFEISGEDEFNSINKVWETPCYDRLIKVIKATSPANGVNFWSLVPNIKYVSQVKKIYDKHYKPNNN